MLTISEKSSWLPGCVKATKMSWGGGVDAENLKVVPDHCRSTIMYVISILSVIRLMMLTYDLWASLSAPSELLVFGSLMPARSFLTLLSTDPSNAPPPSQFTVCTNSTSKTCCEN